MYYVIVNPASRTGKGKTLWSDLEPVLVDRGVDYKVIFSKKAGHVIKLVRDLSGFVLASPSATLKLIVLGGDGTLNEVMQGITDFSRTEVGYIPTGSSNDMARDLKLPNDPVKCLNNILDCTSPKTMDLGHLIINSSTDELSRQHEENIMSEKYFDVSAGIGYDAAVCEEALVSPIKKVLNHFGLGKLVYLFIALKQLLTTKGCDCTIELDDKETVSFKKFLFAATMIHQYEGGGFMFCPNADYSDGVFDICLAADIPKLRILRALPTALKGDHLRFKGIYKYSAKKVVIKPAEPLWVHTDGEVTMKSNQITMTCEKEILKMLY